MASLCRFLCRYLVGEREKLVEKRVGCVETFVLVNIVYRQSVFIHFANIFGSVLYLSKYEINILFK